MSAGTILPEQADVLKDDRGNDPEAWLARRMILFCQLVFRDRDPGDFHWSDDEDSTEILITDQVPMPMSSAEQRPIIQLVISTQQHQNLTLDHLEKYDLRTGQRTHVDLLSGQASFNIHAKFDTTARRVARYVMRDLVQQRRELTKLAQLHFVGHVVNIGPSSPPGALVQAGSDVESTMVAVMFPFFYAEKWIVTPKMIPLGQADPDAKGATRRQGVNLENPGTIKEINVSANMLKPGVVWKHEEGLRQIRSAPITPPTIQGRPVELVRRLDEIQDDDNISPYVENNSVAEEE